jgi:DNA polymerase III alpha subunit (gram-positive type)
VLPRIPVSDGDAAITGIEVVDGHIRCYGNPVDALNINQGLTDFLTFLKQFPRAVLVTHNCRQFDSIRLVRTVHRLDRVSELCGVVTGFVESLLLMRALHPGLSSYSQVNLVASLLYKTYSAHDALADVRTLEELVSGVPSDVMMGHFFSVDSVVQ